MDHLIVMPFTPRRLSSSLRLKQIEHNGTVLFETSVTEKLETCFTLRCHCRNHYHKGNPCKNILHSQLTLGPTAVISAPFEIDHFK